MAKRQITKSFWADPVTRRAEMRLEMPWSASIRPQPGQAAQAQPVAEVAQCWGESGKQANAAESVSPLPVNEILPRPEDLVYFNFRAISQRLVECYSVDYTRPGVLEASTALLLDQRVCKDHRNWKAEDAMGRIVQSVWDAEGKNSNNLPGINIRFFVDSKIEPRLVRLLSYGAVRSGSVTVGFEWEPSHPQLLESGKFWWFLGQEIEGQIVRLIVTKILFYTEFSPVYEGADEDAKRIPDDAMPMPDGAGDDENGRKKDMYSAAQSQERPTVKVTAAQKTFLGLQHQGEDVPDSDVLAALDRVAQQSAEQQATLAAANALIAAERAEVLRLATVAELGSAEGALNPALAALIQQAPATQLAELKKLYSEKAATKLGAKDAGPSRSSVEPDHGYKPQGGVKPVEQMPFL